MVSSKTSKNKSKNFKNKFSFQKNKKIYLCAYGQILKVFHAYFLKDKIIFFPCFKNAKIDIVSSL
jgi:hypothetical protein